MDRIDAVIETYRRVGPAMTQTTIVGGLGLFVFCTVNLHADPTIRNVDARPVGRRTHW